MPDAIGLQSFPRLSREDVVSLEIDPGSDSTAVEFVLESNRSITWWKALEVHDPSDRIIASVETQDADRGPHATTVSAAKLRGARLVLAKAKLFGIHTPMYELRSLDREVGNSLHFVWESDSDTAGPVAGFFRDLGRGLDAASNAAADAVEWLGTGLGDALGDIVETIGNGIAAGLDWVGGLFGGGKHSTIAGRIFHWLGTIVSAAFDLVGVVIHVACDLVADAIGGALRIGGGIVGGLLSWDFGVFARSALRGVVDVFAPLGGGLVLLVLKIVALIHACVGQQDERPLTKDERALLERVYRGSVAYANIRVIPGSAGIFDISADPFTLGEKIYMKSTAADAWSETLVHECCHVWQYQHLGSRYVAEAMAAIPQPDGYDWQEGFAQGAASWRDLNREQEAQFLEDCWTGGSNTVSGAVGDGVFYVDDPVGPDVEFERGTVSFTSLAIEAVTYVRGNHSLRLSQFI